MLDSLHIALGTGAIIATVTAAFAIERWQHHRRSTKAWQRTANSLGHEQDALKDSLNRSHTLLNDTEHELFLSNERLVACERRFNERAAMIRMLNVELDALKAKQAARSEAIRKGNLTRTAKRLALRNATTAALQACVGGR